MARGVEGKVMRPLELTAVLAPLRGFGRQTREWFET